MKDKKIYEDIYNEILQILLKQERMNELKEIKVRIEDKGLFNVYKEIKQKELLSAEEYKIISIFNKMSDTEKSKIYKLDNSSTICILKKTEYDYLKRFQNFDKIQKRYMKEWFEFVENS